MRILLVGDYPSDPRLGSTKVHIKLQEEFQALGHECDLLLRDDLGEWPLNRQARQALGPVLAFRAILRRFRERGPYDVVDVASAEGLWLAAAKRLGAFRNVVVIARSHGLEHLNYRRMLVDHQFGVFRKPWTRRIYYPIVRLNQVRFAARLSDRFILLNDGDLAYALDHHWKASSRIDVVSHGVSASFLNGSPTGEHPRGRGILFCGSWSPMKGVKVLTDAYDRMIDSGLVVNLTILGGGVDRHLIEKDFGSRARQSLTIIDRADECEVMEAYRTHDVLAWPSTYEGFGMVLLEAMTQRLPVVATPVGCATRLVENGRTGLLVPARDPDALSSALVRMLQDPALRARTAEAAFARVQGMTWASTARATLAVYGRARIAG